jgi:hypothetical protein
LGGAERFPRFLRHQQRQDAACKKAEEAFKSAVVQQSVGAVSVSEAPVALRFGAVKGLDFGGDVGELCGFQVVELQVLVPAEQKVEGVVTARGDEVVVFGRVLLP